jgi:mono/diheme cytochrome c family protein
MNRKTALRWCAVVLVSVSPLLLRPGNSQEHSKARSPEAVRLIDSLRGAELYKAYCAVCHGPDGKGGGPMARSLKAVPADLTQIAKRNGGKFPSPRVEVTISGEEQVPEAHGTRDMPLWGPLFSQIAWDQDLGRVRLHNLAKYLEELQAK